MPRLGPGSVDGGGGGPVRQRPVRPLVVVTAVNASRRAWSWPIVAGWAGWPSATILLATVARPGGPQHIEGAGYRSLRGDALGPLRDAAAARTRVITLVTAQLMEYFQESGLSQTV